MSIVYDNGIINNNIADELRCPITQMIMIDPCISSDGFTYERKAILKWISNFHASGQPPTSPKTGQILTSTAIISNRTLRSTISKFIEQHPEFKEEYKNSDSLINDEQLIKEKIESFKSASLKSIIAIPINVSSQTENIPFATVVDNKSMSHSSTSTVKYEGAKLPYVISSSKTSLYDRKGITIVWESDGKGKWEKSMEWPLTSSSSSPPSQPSDINGNRSLSKEYSFSLSNSFVLNSEKTGNAPSSSSLSSTASTWLDSSINCMSLLNTNKLSGWEEYVTGNRDNSLAIYKLQLSDYGTVKSFGIVNTGDSFRKKDGHKDIVKCVKAISPSNLIDDSSDITNFAYCDKIISGSRDTTLRLWKRKSKFYAGMDDQTWECASVMNGHQDFVNCCDIFEGSVVSGSADWNLLLWDTEISNPDPIQELTGHSLSVRCCSFSQSSAHSRILASGSDDETVKIWDPRSSRSCINTFHCDSIVLSCCWNPNISEGNSPIPFLAASGGIPMDSLSGDSGNIGGWIRVWDPRTWKLIGDCSLMGTSELPSYIVSKAANSDGQKSNKCTEGDIPPARIAHRHAVNCLQTFMLSKSGDKIGILSGGLDKKIRLWEMSQIGEELSAPRYLTSFEELHKAPIDSLCISRM